MSKDSKDNDSNPQPKPTLSTKPAGSNVIHETFTRLPVQGAVRGTQNKPPKR